MTIFWSEKIGLILLSLSVASSILGDSSVAVLTVVSDDAAACSTSRQVFMFISIRKDVQATQKQSR